MGVFIDFSKSFDCVQHNLLVYKLERYGVRGIALNWFESFLSGHTQQVKVLSHVSSKCEVKVGIPQGLVIGLSLFIILINDLLLNLQTLATVTVEYVDNTNFLIVSGSAQTAKFHVNCTLNL